MMLTASHLSLACPREPAYDIAHNPERVYEKSDIVFFGQITRLEESEYIGTKSRIPFPQQIVEFSIEKIFKGPTVETAKVVNKFHTTCSRKFYKEARYYVFANHGENEGEFIIDGYASFVPEAVAVEKNMILNPAHNNTLKEGTPQGGAP